MLFKNNPEDTCAYKRQLIVCFITAIVTFHSFLIWLLLRVTVLRNDGKHAISYVLPLFISYISLILGYELIEHNIIFNDFIFWKELSIGTAYFYSFIPLIYGMLALILFVGILALIVYLLYKSITFLINNYLKKINVPHILTDDNDEPVTQLGVVYKSAKEKWCKKINWN